LSILIEANISFKDFGILRKKNILTRFRINAKYKKNLRALFILTKPWVNRDKRTSSLLKKCYYLISASIRFTRTQRFFAHAPESCTNIRTLVINKVSSKVSKFLILSFKCLYKSGHIDLWWNEFWLSSNVSYIRAMFPIYEQCFLLCNNSLAEWLNRMIKPVNVV